MKGLIRRARSKPRVVALVALVAALPSMIVVPVAVLGFHAAWHEVAGGVYAAPLVFLLYVWIAFGDAPVTEPK